MKASFRAAILAAAALYPAAAVGQDGKRVFVLVDPATGTVEERVTAVASEVAALKAEVAELRKALTAASAVQPAKAGGCKCGDVCPCAAPKAAAPSAGPLYLVGGRWVGEAEFRGAYPAAVQYAAPAGYTCGPNGCQPAPAFFRRGR